MKAGSVLRHLLLSLLALLGIAACATEWHGPTTEQKNGKTLCILHHVPLQQRQGYRYAGSWEGIDDGRYRFPNPWPVAVSSKKFNDFTIPTKVIYCKICDQKAGIADD